MQRTQSVGFAKDTVMSDLTLYCQMDSINKIIYVRFETNGGNRIEDAVVAEGEKDPEPTVPVREGMHLKAGTAMQRTQKRGILQKIQ